ncbi:MAG: single-stranded-DNA-specific exonuclease RecJ [Thermoleophilaceae bacterium]
MPTSAEWTCSPYDAVHAAALEDVLGLSPATAAILLRRGLTDPDDARAFLAGEARSDPLTLPGAPEACDLVLRHVKAASPILVFGDYDVDGVCSTAMMVGVLRALGADPAWQLPSRSDDGYGLSPDGVRALADTGARLLITVDCGITAVQEVELAKELGMDVLITDHHRPGEQLPDCPIVHPGLGGAGDSHLAAPPPGAWPESSTELCAAGVVLKLSEALRARAGLDPRKADEDLDLAGLATICDMVPLRGENRRIAREGLAALARTRRPGLRALMREADLEPGEMDARAASFRLGPRLNAAGRMQRADAALELLMTPDEERAVDVARELGRLNLDRRETEQRILSEADAACLTQLSAAAIVVAGEGWHPGVVGIVASRLVERHRRPCVVIALDGETGRGSARSISAYDVHEGIAASAQHLTRFGGHRMAAGLEIDRANIEAFREALALHAGDRLAPADLKPVQPVDAVVSAGALTLDLAEELDRLGPSGAGNPAPTLLVPAARIEHVTAMGEGGDHARFSLAGGAGRARGVAFRTSQAGLAAAGAEPHDVAVSLERNRWNGTVEARVVLRSLTPTRPGRLHDVAPPEGFWEELEREMGADPALWWPEPAAASPADAPGARAVRDRRDEGMAALATDLLTSGEPVLVVVADLERRRASLERMLAGVSPGGLAAMAWEALAAQPALAEPYTHLLALDPPPVEAGVELAARASGTGMLHLAWGKPERAFTLSHWRAQLDLRPALAELWRALDGGRLEGESLDRVLRGAGSYPRRGAVGGRLLRVLHELGLLEYRAPEPGSPASCRARSGARTDLDRSQANRAYAARLAAVERHLGAHHASRGEQAAPAG